MKSKFIAFFIIVSIVFTFIPNKSYAMIETTIDVSSFVWSATECISKPSIPTCGIAVWDLTSVVSPLPSSSIIKAGTKTFNRLEAIMKVGSKAKVAIKRSNSVISKEAAQKLSSRIWIDYHIIKESGPSMISKLERRGWTKSKIQQTISNNISRKSVSKGTNWGATAFFSDDGYVVVEDFTKRVIQISDTTNADFIVDKSIKFMKGDLYIAKK